MEYEYEEFDSESIDSKTNEYIPKSVYSVNRSDEENRQIRLRRNPRRIIMGLVVNHELALTEVRIRSLYHLVETFVICESNTSIGKIFSLYQYCYKGLEIENKTEKPSSWLKRRAWQP